MSTDNTLTPSSELQPGIIKTSEYGPDWQVWSGLSDYSEAAHKMQQIHKEVQQDSLPEQLLLLEHPPVYTEGTSAKETDLTGHPDVSIVRKTGRGGQWTYHGPGIRIVWPVLNLNNRRRDVRLYVHSLEAWIIDSLSHFGVQGQRREGLPGIWVSRSDIGLPDRRDKIAAIGVRLSRWVSQHGLAINIDPDLSHFDGIVPCGVTDGEVTSLADLGLVVSQTELDMALQSCFEAHFGPQAPMGVINAE